MPLRFKLIPICYQNAENHDSDEVEFLLEYDNWNDYGKYLLSILEEKDQTLKKNLEY